MLRCRKCNKKLNPNSKNAQRLCGACQRKSRVIGQPPLIINNQAFCPFCSEWKDLTLFKIKHNKPQTDICRTCDSHRQRNYRKGIPFHRVLRIDPGKLLYGTGE